MKTIIPLVEKSRKALSVLKELDVAVMNAVLHDMADALVEHQDIIIKLNIQDVKNGNAMLLSPLSMDRLILNEANIRTLTDFIRSLAGNEKTLRLTNNDKSSMIDSSVIAVIYESRPFLTAMASCLAFRSKNAIILRGGKEAFHTNTAISSILCDVLDQNGLPRELITLIPTTDRVSMTELIGLKDLIDYVIPKGSEGLLHYVAMNSKIPIMTHIPALD